MGARTASASLLIALAAASGVAQEMTDWGRELPIIAQIGLGAPVRALAVRDGVLYVCCDRDGLATMSLSNPREPKLLGRSDTFQAFDVALRGDYAYVADRYGGVQVIDVSDPAEPTLITTYDTIEFATDVEVAGDLLLVPCRTHGTEVVSIAERARPRHLGFARCGESQGVQVRDRLAYVAVWQESLLAILDLEDPCSPRIVSRHPLHGYGYGLTLGTGSLAGYVFVAHGHHDRSLGAGGTNRGHGFDVIDVRNPAQPETVATVSTPDYFLGGPDSWQCALSGTRLFLADGPNGLFVFDVSDPAKPRPLAHCDTPGYAHNLALEEGLVYVADYREGLVVVDAAGLASPPAPDPGEPPAAPGGCPPLECGEATYTAAGQVRSVAVDGEWAFVASGSAGLEVLALPTLERAGGLALGGIAYDVAVADDLACVACGPAGVTLVDVANATAPRLIATALDGRYARQLVRFGDRLVVLTGNATIDVVSISDAAAPEVIGSVALEHFGWQIAPTLLRGRYVVVGNGFGVRIIDLDAEGGPALAWSHDTREALGFSTNGVALVGEILIASGHRQLRTFDLRDPARLESLHEARVGQAPARLTVGETLGGVTRVWSACPTTGGVVVAEVFADGRIEVLSEMPTPGHASQVALAGERALVADGYAGLHAVSAMSR